MSVTRVLRAAGRVQGVGYRDALRDAAVAHGLSGWVRNRRDGSVEALLQGGEAAVEAVIAWARRGPPAARVAKVECRDAQDEFDRPLTGFERRPTA